MTTNLVTLPPDAPLEAVAHALADRGISGAPVVDSTGTLLGMVTEGDLIKRLSAKDRVETGWFAGLFQSAAGQAARYARVHGHKARDVMTTDLATVSEDTSIEHIARIIEDKGIRRVPVVRDGKLVGLVSRADLIRAMIMPEDAVSADAPDSRIRRDVLKAMRDQPWVDTYFIFADVKDGVVTFHGFCRSDQVKQGLRVLAEGIDGVKGVTMELQAPPPMMMGMA
jgi:CBS domain-containing protein